MARLFVSIAVAAGVALVLALALTVLDLYLTGHGHTSINREIVSIPSAGVHLSASDIALLAGAVAAGLATWFRQRGRP